MAPDDIEFSCFDKDGILVTCSKSQWAYLTKHQEMLGQQGLVKFAIEKPEFICQSIKHKKRRTIYKLCVFPPPYGSAYVRVVVEYRKKLIGRNRGYVINAFTCDGMQEGEVLLWERQLE